MKFVVLDFEATGLDIATTHVIEWATVSLMPLGMPRMDTGLCKPPIPIPPETSAVHHIIDADVQKQPTWKESGLEFISALMLPADKEYVAVAHNIDMERGILLRDNPAFKDVQWICTYRCALRVWPDFPRHNNEALRYQLGLGTGRSIPQHPHTAWHDAQVTSQIFSVLRGKASIEDMLKWSAEVPLLPRCPLGAWRDRKWSEVDDGFLYWILRTIEDREDVRFAARIELSRREEERRKADAERRAEADREAAQREEPDPQEDIPF